jgi:hypothetical protein
MNGAYWALDDWFKKNLMSLNTTKTNYINFTVKNQIVKEREDIDTYYYFQHKSPKISRTNHSI